LRTPSGRVSYISRRVLFSYDKEKGLGTEHKRKLETFSTISSLVNEGDGLLIPKREREKRRQKPNHSQKPPGYQYLVDLEGAGRGGGGVSVCGFTGGKA